MYLLYSESYVLNLCRFDIDKAFDKISFHENVWNTEFTSKIVVIETKCIIFCNSVKNIATKKIIQSIFFIGTSSKEPQPLSYF